ncbi:MAG: hypothetical protein LRY28_05840 [Erysipelotrichaceae bacterium]|nr:hypothetical protein [Erysipelotrichaceae bacterium]
MNSNLTKIKLMIQDPLRKPLLQIGYELFLETRRLKRLPKEYLSRFVYRKGYPSLKHYVSDALIGQIQLSQRLHSPQSVQLLLNKLAFFKFAKEHDIPTATVLAYSKEGKLYTIDDQPCDSSTVELFKQTLNQWIQTSPLHSLFIKPNDLKGGVGAFRIDEKSLQESELIQKIHHQVLNSTMLIQETLVQHPLLNAINPSSINTIRLDTYQPLHGEARVIAGCMRFGRVGSVVDNPGTSKGFFVKLNLETQQLEGVGQQILTFGNQTFTHHPDTLHPLDGVKIPYVKEAMELVIKATQSIQDRLIGWDVCITPNGPVLIEGNHNYHIVMLEIANGGYALRENYQDVILEVIEEHSKLSL